MMRKKFVFFPILLLLLCALCFGACTSGGASGDNAEGDFSGKGEIIVGEIDRKIVYYVNMTLEVSDVAAAKGNILGKGAEAGGYVQEQSEYSDDGKIYRMYLVYRIPTDKLDAFVNGVGEQGKVRSKSVSTTDITTEYVNASARKQALEERKAQLEAILSETGLSASDKINVINEISDVNTQLQEIELQLTQYDSLVDYSTVRLTIATKDIDVSAIVSTVFLIIVFLGLVAGVIVLAVKLAGERKKRQNGGNAV